MDTPLCNRLTYSINSTDVELHFLQPQSSQTGSNRRCRKTKMESINFKTLVFSSVSLIVCIIVGVIYKIWWIPKRLEKQLMQQGIKGTSYKLLYGDKKENKRIMNEAWSKPISLNHQITARGSPVFHQMVQKYGTISLSWLGTRPRLIIADAELIRLILNNKNGHFRKPPLNPLLDLLTLGVSTLEGEKWAQRRKLITPAFHYEKLLGMVPSFLVSCCNMVDRWKKVTFQGSHELDIAPEMQNLSADVIARAAFGSSYEEGKRIFELQKEQVVLALEAFYDIYFPGLRQELLESIHFWTSTVLPTSLNQVLFPMPIYSSCILKLNDNAINRFIPTKKNKRRYEVDDEIKAILRGMIKKKEEAMTHGAPAADDLLGLLLQCKGQTDNDMTIDDVIEECKLFHFAGQETTANWLTWTMIILSMHPDWQEKAREEVLQICGKETPNLEAINHLKIVTMVLYEVIRLYPPVTAVFRHTCQKTNVGGMSIPVGVDVVLPILLLHHAPKYWGDDAAEFRPERFAEGVSKASKDQSAFNPFGWGPRICLGQSFAMIEAKLALAMILQHFSFELSPSYTHAPYIIVTLQPQHGAPIILHQI